MTTPAVKFILALAFFAFIACSESKETRMQRFLAQGNDMVSKQNFEEAINFYEGALKLDSCFADALNNLGSVYHRQGNFARANSYYNMAINCKPDYTQAYLNRANTLYELNKPEAALNDLTMVEKSNPDTVALPFARGLIYTRLRDYPKAKQHFRQALALDPGNFELAINMGTVFYYEQKYDSAKFYLMPVILTTPHADAFNTLGMVAVDQQQYDSALNYFDKALALKTNDPYILNNRGYARLMKGEPDKAIDDINESITLDPYNAWAYRNKGIFYLQKNQPEAAIRLLKYAEGIDATIKDLNTYLVKAYEMNHEDSLAKKYRTKGF